MSLQENKFANVVDPFSADGEENKFANVVDPFSDVGEMTHSQFLDRKLSATVLNPDNYLLSRIKGI